MKRPRICDSIQVDRELTRDRHECGVWEDSRSCVHQNGREYLFGIDMTRRRTEVWERDKRMCVECGKWLSFGCMEMHHRAQNYGGPRFDNLDNLETLCSQCHRGKGGKHS